jgi:hypothetical protein
MIILNRVGDGEESLQKLALNLCSQLWFSAEHDLTTPGNDLTTPGNDLTTPGNDLTTPGNDLTTPGNGLTTPGNVLKVQSR